MVERCQCAGSYPHWRVVYADGKVSLPFFARHGLGFERAIHGMKREAARSLKAQFTALTADHAPSQGEIRDLMRVIARDSEAQKIDMHYDLHFIGIGHMTRERQRTWENEPVPLGGDKVKVLCFGRKTEPPRVGATSSPT